MSKRLRRVWFVVTGQRESEASSDYPDRSRSRIPKVTKDLRKVWEEHPELRLGQLLANALNSDDDKLFYIEDRELIQRVIGFSDRWSDMKGTTHVHVPPVEE